MQISRTVRRAEYDRGHVDVYYSNGSQSHFDGIDPAEFERWERSKWKLNRQPTGVHSKPPVVEQDPEEIQAELDAEAEIAEVARRNRRVSRLDAANEAWRVKLGDAEYRRRFGDGPTFRLHWPH
jgi:hypothetical protein